ncbi:MAG TPA: tetratricopeptide repeat protein, partial [Alphaproteobacteria bacterium]|nr:tetratricopeptide repeat protein [Alphaproteobacteria bacterium]
VLAWRYGAPGDDHWKRRDTAAISLNTVLAGAVLFGLFHDMDLRATTTIKLLEDAEGNIVERAVPTAAARRDILLFDFENETGDGDLDWLEHGLPSAVSVDLLQDIFVNVESLFHQPVQERVAEARLGSGDDIPLALMQDIAQARGMDFFVDGTVQRAAAGGGGDDAPPLLARVHLYDTRSGRLLAAREYPMTGPLDATDPISRDLRRAAGIPEEHLEESPDLPVEELITNSPDSFRALAEARARLGRAGDPAGAMERAERAVTLDSTSALAQNVLASAAAAAGDRTTMLAASTAALRYNYRLPEPMRLASEVRAHIWHGDTEAAVRTARYWTERYPQDLWGHEALARAYRLAGDDAGWIRALRGILAIDSTDVGTMGDLAFALFSGPGMTDSAVRHLETARDLHPEDVDIRLDLAGLLGEAGRFDAAREALETAATVAPRDPDVSRFIALLDLRQGDVDRALQRLDEVRARERTPSEIERRAGLEETLFYVTGQFGRLEDAYRRRLALLAASRTPSE